MVRMNDGGGTASKFPGANSALPAGFWKKPGTPTGGLGPVYANAPKAPAPAPPAPSPQQRAPQAAPAPRQSYSAPHNSYSTPSSYGSNSAGNIQPIAAAPPPQPVAPPQPPDINSFLAGDSTYKTQNDQLSKAWADYQNNMNLQSNQYNTDYTGNVKKLGEAQQQGQTSLTDDYASRGLLQSGVYSKAYSDLQNDYTGRQKALDTGKADFGAQLAAAAQNFKSQQGVTGDKAKQDAINRRAAQYGL